MCGHVVPVLLLESLERRHVVDLPQKLAQDGDLMRIGQNAL